MGLALLLPVAGALVATPPAAAADPADGRLLARQWCVSCHAVEPGGPSPDAGPAFAALAKDPAVTPDRLRGWLVAPHPPMPDMSLSRREIESIVSYIESLRTAP
jgi:mono/diheme cytochrome c family protein